jgi:hypothetical protein
LPSRPPASRRRWASASRSIAALGPAPEQASAATASVRSSAAWIGDNAVKPGCPALSAKGLAKFRFTKLRIGSTPSEVQRAYDLANEASDRCIKEIRPGVKFSDIDAIAVRVFDRAGLADRKGFGVGHSHRLMGPFWGREKLGEFRPYNHAVLEEGMITSMEPSLFIPDVGPLFTNDMILVTKDGAEVITNYPRELKRID